jgi:hypothetical protein
MGTHTQVNAWGEKHVGHAVLRFKGRHFRNLGKAPSLGLVCLPIQQNGAFGE